MRVQGNLTNTNWGRSKPSVTPNQGKFDLGRTSEAGKNKKSSHESLIVYLKTDDMLYSGGNGTGLSYTLKYADDSTKENPIIIAKGIDEYGKEFETTINVNDINPLSANVVEMQALGCHLGVDKCVGGGLSTLPLGTGNQGLYEKTNFMELFQKEIRDQTTLGQYAITDRLKEYVNIISSFMNSKNSY